MKKYKIILAVTLIISNIYSWYPDYTVLATDFKLRNDFLLPTQLKSVNLIGLSRHFKNLYNEYLENTQINPAYLNFSSSNYFYFDFAGEEFKQNGGYDVPIHTYAQDASTTSSDYLPYYWSPYRDISDNEIGEPTLRAIYLGKPFCKLPLGIGITAEYFYDQTKFYQPYWYGWGAEKANATDQTYAQGTQDPYQDYRIVEAGANEETTDGYRLGGLVSYPFNKFVIGLNYTFHSEDVDGLYRNLDNYENEHSNSQYHNYYDSRRNQKQEFIQNDIALGLIWQYDKKSLYGIKIGHVRGDINRTYAHYDTSSYRSRYNFYSPDSSAYRSWSNLENDKKWQYDGTSYYVTLHGDIKLQRELLLRFSLFHESAQADLDESEKLYRSSVYRNNWWNNNDSKRQKIYDNSWAKLVRSGTGEFSRNKISFTTGVDWNLSSTLRFIGGINLQNLEINHNADEPLTGEKHSIREVEGYKWFDYNTLRISQEDKKEFRWQQNKNISTFAILAGVIVSPLKYFDFRIGITKIFQRQNIEESYDVVVHKDKNTTVSDGKIQIVDKSEYVDGHHLPDIKKFIDDFEFNFGATIKKDEKFSVTAVLTESLYDPRSLKIGAHVSW